MVYKKESTLFKRFFLSKKPHHFTHYCGRNRWGTFDVGRKTSRKKFRQKGRELNDWLRNVRNLCAVKAWWPTLKAKLRGHYQYYGISGNTRAIVRFYRLAVRLTRKWLNLRSQRPSFGKVSFDDYLEHYPLPKPRIVHKPCKPLSVS